MEQQKLDTSNIHGQDVIVSDFNGNVTKGLDNHLEWTKNLVAVQPDSKIVSHPIKIASDIWTVVTGTLPGYIHDYTLSMGRS